MSASMTFPRVCALALLIVVIRTPPDSTLRRIGGYGGVISLPISPNTVLLYRAPTGFERHRGEPHAGRGRVLYANERVTSGTAHLLQTPRHCPRSLAATHLSADGPLT